MFHRGSENDVFRKLEFDIKEQEPYDDGLVEQINRKGMPPKPGEKPGWFVARKFWDGKASGVFFVQNITQGGAEEADTEPRQKREVIDGVLSDVGLVDTYGELEDGRVFCRKE